jgi:hypothetical protein
LYWTYKHLGRVKPEDAPTPQKRSLLLLAEKKPADFHRRYQRALPSITSRLEAKETERKRRLKELEWERQRPQREEEERKRRAAERKRDYRERKRAQREAEMRAEQERRRLQAEKEKLTADTLKVLRERRTRIVSMRASVTDDLGRSQYGTVEFLVPAWPYDADPTVVKSAEAVKWQAELDAAKKRAQEKTSAEVTEMLARMTQGKPFKSVKCYFW